jgi:outer membrane protein assembly factor BamB
VAVSRSTTIVHRWIDRTPGVLALDASTGSTRWSLERVEPVVADRAVRHVIALERETEVRRILSIEVTSGEVRWSRRLRVGAWSPWSPSVLLAHRLVVVAVWTGARRRLVVVRAAGGGTVWSRRARGTPFAVASGTILTIRVDRRHEGFQIVEGIDLEHGRILWSFRSPYYTTIGAAGGGRAFVDHLQCMGECQGDYGGTYRSSVTALDVATGRVLWRRAGNEAHGTVAWWAAALANGLVYVDRLRHGRATFGALDAATGRLRWMSTFGPRGVSGAIHIVANGAVFGALRFGERGGRIVRLALPPEARSARRGRDES